MNKDRSIKKVSDSFTHYKLILDIKDIVQFVLFSSLVYFAIHFETVGSLVLDIVFEQFYFELMIVPPGEIKNKPF